MVRRMDRVLCSLLVIGPRKCVRGCCLKGSFQYVKVELSDTVCVFDVSFSGPSLLFLCIFSGCLQ